MSYKAKWIKTRRKVDARLEESSESSEERIVEQSDQIVYSDIGNDNIVDNEEASVSFSSVASSSLSCRLSGLESESDYENLHNRSTESSSDGEIVSDDDFDDEDDSFTFCEKLANCAINNKWSHESVRQLLAILREENMDVPKDPRTILKTPKNIPVVEKCGGDYFYMGIEKGIVRYLSNSENLPNVISLRFNIDGLPLFKSTHIHLWPILAYFENNNIFIVAVFAGKAKPDPLEDYLEDFIEEINRLCLQGINFNGILIPVTIHSFICDAPARSYLKGTIGHNGYFGCERCVEKGESLASRTVYHEETVFPLRNNLTFRNMGYKQHQLRETPLTEINFDIINQFPLDYMHLVCLGVVRRILNYFKRGPGAKLSANHIEQINQRLVSYNGCLPSEFARQPRSLKELDRWKATELRQFLLYTGPIAIHKIVSNDIYNHFMVLSVALSILLQEDANIRIQYLDYAKDLLKSFVYNAKHLYGPYFTVYNIHHLIHLGDDCSYFGCSLNELSAFPFENFMQHLKRCIRSKKHVAVQIANRQSEYENNIGGVLHCKKDIKVSPNRKDRCFHLANGEFAFVRKNEKNHAICDVIKRHYLKDLFDIPMPSSNLNIFLLERGHKTHFISKQIATRDLSSKCVCLPVDKGFAIFPTLH